VSTSDTRVVIVTRKTPLVQLIERWGTRTQAEFYLKTRGQQIEDYEAADAGFTAALEQVTRQIPAARRRTAVDRSLLDRFIFAPDDVVVFVGQDGLVANAAKYLDGQLAIGVNPDPSRYEGVLVPFAPAAFGQVLQFADTRQGSFTIERRTMVEALREDGQKLLALNEIYIGHRTHQSSRYRIRFAEKEERHSSSGIIVATGTGATGWARSISRPLKDPPPLPQPSDTKLAFFVREAWPSVATGVAITTGVVEATQTLGIFSDMPEDGLAFGDGIESDPVEFLSGQSLKVQVSKTALQLVKNVAKA
jgi:NAD kinase